jgi:hypothetical protein
LRDKDGADCVDVKKRLLDLCGESGKSNALVRIACHELESWYLADLLAVEKALAIEGLSAHQKKSKFRQPDNLANAAQELEKLTKYQYKKTSGSRLIGQYIDPDNTRSDSFRVFIEGVRRLLAV